MSKPNAFTAPPKTDPAWLKKVRHSQRSSEGGRLRASKLGGQVVPGMGTRDLEKTKVSR